MTSKELMDLLSKLWRAIQHKSSIKIFLRLSKHGIKCEALLIYVMCRFVAKAELFLALFGDETSSESND